MLDPEDYYRDEDDLEQGNERSAEPDARLLPKICEGQRVPHAHKDDAREYRYLTGDDADVRANLCSRCVAFERKHGLILERTFIEEE